MPPLPQRPAREGLPFAVEPTADGSLALRKARVIQCALSRVCGVCADALGRPIAFAGSEPEIGAGSFHFPPMHRECAEQLVHEHGEAWEMLGQSGPVSHWTIVTTSAFEFVRPDRDDADPRPRFEVHEVIDRLPVLH